jgi:hypothetical protein
MSHQLLERFEHGTQLVKAGRRVLRGVNLNHLGPLPTELHRFLLKGIGPNWHAFAPHPKGNRQDFLVGQSPGLNVRQVNS